MKMQKEDEFNGGPASCPPDQQETLTDMDDQGRITTKIYKIDPNTANKQILMSKVYTPVCTLKDHLNEYYLHKQHSRMHHLGPCQDFTPIRESSLYTPIMEQEASEHTPGLISELTPGINQHIHKPSLPSPVPTQQSHLIPTEDDRNHTSTPQKSPAMAHPGHNILAPATTCPILSIMATSTITIRQSTQDPRSVTASLQ